MASQYQTTVTSPLLNNHNVRFHDVPLATVIEGALVGAVLYALLFSAGSIAAAVIAIAYAFYRTRGADRTITLIVLYGAWQSLDTATFSGVSFQQSALGEGLSGPARALLLLALGVSLLPLIRRSTPRTVIWLVVAVALCTACAVHLFMMEELISTTVGRLFSAGLLIVAGLVVVERSATLPSLEGERLQGANAAGIVLGLLTALLLIGIALFAIGAGNRVNGDFQGSVVHPQTWGLVGGALAIMAFAFGRRFGVFYLVSFLAAVTIWLSGTRTALLALLLGIGLDVILTALPKRGYAGGFIIFAAVAISAAASLLLLALFASGSIVSATDALLSAYIEARGVLFYESAFNFALHPTFGIGFGVPSDVRLLDPEVLAESISTFGATGEKGSSYIALFEENGLLLGFPWITLLTVLLVRAGQSTILAGAILYLILISHGEAVLLSLSGPAALVWGTILAGVVADKRPTVLAPMPPVSAG
jgi:hypothetical protein